MKKLIAAVLSIFLFCMVTSAHAERVWDVGKKWNSTSIAPDTDWFSADITPNQRNLESVKHTFQFMCPTTTVVNMQLVFNSITKVLAFNSGVALDANNGYVFTVLLQKNMSYNIQHKTGTQNCSVIITESGNADL
jgi:hypothetical protein